MQKCKYRRGYSRVVVLEENSHIALLWNERGQGLNWSEISVSHTIWAWDRVARQNWRAVAASAPWSKELTADVLYPGLTLLSQKISWNTMGLCPHVPALWNYCPVWYFSMSLWTEWYLPPIISYINTVPASSPAFHYWWGSPGGKQLTDCSY